MPTGPRSPESIGASPDESLRTRRDHEAIAHLADELLPALIAKLAASGLGEIEVHEAGWKARLRKPAAAAGARASAARTAEGHAAAADSPPVEPPGFDPKIEIAARDRMKSRPGSRVGSPPSRRPSASTTRTATWSSGCTCVPATRSAPWTSSASSRTS